jgi:hypothetical protein
MQWFHRYSPSTLGPVPEVPLFGGAAFFAGFAAALAAGFAAGFVEDFLEFDLGDLFLFIVILRAYNTWLDIMKFLFLF